MLSIEKCREILGDDGIDMTDERIIELRASLYELGELSLEDYFDSVNKKS